MGVGVGNSFLIPDRRVGEHRCRLGFGSMLNGLEFFEEELNAGAGWGQGQIKVGVRNSFTIFMMGSMLNDLEFVKEEVNTGAGWGRGQIKVWVGVGNFFITLYLGCGQCQIFLNFLKKS